jgi:hypothetical protein
MDNFEFEAGRSFDRRIGRRAVTPPIDVTWVVPATGLLRTARERPGSVVEVSLTGAAVTGPANLKVKVGDTVLLRFAGGESSVIVRRIDPAEGDGARVAVELVVVHPVLERQLLGALSLPEGGDMGSTRFQPAPQAGSGDRAGTEGAPSADASPYDALAAAEELAALSTAAPETEPVADAPAKKAPMTSAADADEVRDLVDELRRFMDD